MRIFNLLEWESFTGYGERCGYGEDVDMEK